MSPAPIHGTSPFITVHETTSIGPTVPLGKKPPGTSGPEANPARARTPAPSAPPNTATVPTFLSQPTIELGINASLLANLAPLFAKLDRDLRDKRMWKKAKNSLRGAAMTASREASAAYLAAADVLEDKEALDQLLRDYRQASYQEG